MQRSTVTSLSIIATALLLVGCGAPPTTEDLNDTDANAQPDNSSVDANGADPAGASGTAVLSYGDTTYTASLQHCVLGEDALFHGAAVDETDDQVGYLSGDFGDLGNAPYGEARLDFGATGAMQSTDEFIAMGTSVGQIVVTDASDTSLILAGGVWDQNGSQVATATLKVTC